MSQNKVKIKGIWIPIHIWQMEELSVNERVLLTEIWHLEDVENRKGCTASNAFFATLLNCSVRTVQNYLEKLRDMDLIKTVLKKHPEKGTVRELFVTDRFLVDDKDLRASTRDERVFMGGDESGFMGGVKPVSPVEYNREYNNNTSYYPYGVKSFTVKEWVNKVYTNIFYSKAGTRPHLTPQVYGAAKRLFQQVQSRFQLTSADTKLVFEYATSLTVYFYDNIAEVMPYADSDVYPNLQTMTSNAVMDALFQKYGSGKRKVSGTQASSEVEDTDLDKYGSLEEQIKKQEG